MDMSLQCRTYRELLVGGKKRQSSKGTAIAADTANCVRGGPLYPARVADFLHLQFGWNRGVIVHLIPFGDEGVFCFYKAKLTLILKLLLTIYENRKRKGKLLWLK